MTHYSIGIKSKEYDEEQLDLISPEIVKKEWGSEQIVHNKAHCYKIMSLKPGYQVSMHFHSRKEETFILTKGELLVETVTPQGDLRIIHLTEPLESLTIGVNVPHTFYCPEGQIIDTVFLEASTSDRKDDSYRYFASRKR